MYDVTQMSDWTSWSRWTTLTLCLGGAQFKSWPGHQVSWVRFFCGFTHSVQAKTGMLSYLGHNRILPNFSNSFSFMSTCYLTVWCGIVTTLGVSINNLWKNHKFACLQIPAHVRNLRGKMSSRVVAKDHQIDCFSKGNIRDLMWCNVV
jgi:hypothetical protein